MSPEQVKFPVSPKTVQPVEPDPPARFNPPDPTAPPKFMVVAVVLKRARVVALVFIVGALRESIPPEPLFGERTIFPVVFPPNVNVCPLVVWRLPNPVRYVAIFPEFAEILAVGVPLLTFMKANLAAAVETPPIPRSKVEFPG